MSLLRLPNELILEITDLFDDEVCINALLQTCRRFAALLHPSLYVFDARYGNSKALGWAAKKGIEATARYALQFGAPVDTQYDICEIGEYTAFAIACYFGHEPIARLLLEHGAEINTVKETEAHLLGHGTQNFLLAVLPPKPTPLTLAAFRGQKNIVKLLLSKEYRAKNTLDSSPITAAMTNGHITIVRLIVKHGDRLLVKEGYHTDLGFAIASMNQEGYDLCNYLINIPKPHNAHWVYAALDSAAQKGLLDIFNLLRPHVRLDTLESSKVVSLALKATQAGHFAVAEEVREFLNINDLVRSPQGSELLIHSVLLISAACGWCDMMNKILECGLPTKLSFSQPDVDQDPQWRLLERKNRKGNSTVFRSRFLRDAFPLDLAAYYDRYDAVEILLHHKADVDPPFPGFASPLLFAIAGGHEKIVDLLLRHGANPHLTTDEEHGTPFITAFESENPEIIRLMIDAGKEGFEKLSHIEHEFAVMYALHRGIFEFLNFLTESGWIWDDVWKNWDSNCLLTAAMHGPAESVSFVHKNFMKSGFQTDYDREK